MNLMDTNINVQCNSLNLMPSPQHYKVRSGYPSIAGSQMANSI